MPNAKVQTAHNTAASRNINKPARRTPVTRSPKTAHAISAVKSGMLLVRNMPMCAAGAHCAPPSTTKPKGKPPQRIKSASRVMETCRGKSPI